MEIINIINGTIATLFIICYSYQVVYTIVSLIIRKKGPKLEGLKNRFAVLIAARNEEFVIGNLIDSIKKQDYPSELIDIFVVADNCTDNTYEVAKSEGAIAYQRYDNAKIGKGYALDFLIHKVLKKYGKNYYDGYLIFDADNLLEKEFITEINKVFSSGYEVVTSYRNSKNFGDNWVSAGSAIWFLREAKFVNNARMILGTSCAVSGTGFVVSKKIINKYKGWKWYGLTEDLEFTANCVLNGIKIGYAENAVVYDEQPTSFMASWNQRMRWVKGSMQVAKKLGVDLAKSIIFNSNFASYDMLINLGASFVLNFICVIVNVISYVMSLLVEGNAYLVALSLIELIIRSYLMLFAFGALTTITEWKKIRAPWYEKILYTFSFPLFGALYVPISFISVFVNVKWKKIAHTKCVKLDELA